MAKKGSEWSPEQIKLLEDHYPNKKTSELVELIGKTIDAIYGQAFILGLKKSLEYRRSEASRIWTDKPIGSEYLDGNGYRIRKVNNSKIPHEAWRPAHMVVWESNHGPVPHGYIISFKDGNRKNVEPENLEIITRKEMLRRNSIHQYPPDVIQLIRAQRKLEKIIKEENAKCMINENREQT